MVEPLLRYVRTSDDVNIAYSIMGEGNAILYATNIWGDLQYYIHNPPTRAAVDRLVEEGWQVVRYDGRGMGSSDRNVSEFSLESRVRDLEAVAAKIRAKTFVLCGYGQGGPGAILFSLRHPGSVSHLVLVNTFGRGTDYYASNPLARTLGMMRPMAESEYEFFTLALANAGLSFRDSTQARDIARMMQGSMSPEGVLSYVEAARDIDLVSLLREISVPTLVVEDSSGLVTGDLNRYLAAEIPDALYVRSDDYTRELTWFVRRDDTGTGPRASGFRAILFTDVVSSTPLLAQLKDAKIREVMPAHDEVLEAAVTGNGGRVIKTIGDAFMAEFAVPSGASKRRSRRSAPCASASLPPTSPSASGSHQRRRADRRGRGPARRIGCHRQAAGVGCRGQRHPCERCSEAGGGGEGLRVRGPRHAGAEGIRGAGARLGGEVGVTQFLHQVG